MHNFEQHMCVYIILILYYLFYSKSREWVRPQGPKFSLRCAGGGGGRWPRHWGSEWKHEEEQMLALSGGGQRRKGRWGSLEETIAGTQSSPLLSTRGSRSAKPRTPEEGARWADWSPLIGAVTPYFPSTWLDIVSLPSFRIMQQTAFTHRPFPRGQEHHGLPDQFITESRSGSLQRPGYLLQVAGKRQGLGRNFQKNSITRSIYCWQNPD